MDLEGFVSDMFDNIQNAAKDNSSYILELTPEEVKELAELWSKTEWIEIY